tara:strand:- start:1571 stop:2179 length:609 start_codon:yes stop_codon:yes gene_type:complete
MTEAFFTWSSFGTLTGSTLVVVVVGNVLADVFGWRRKWFLLLLSILVSWAASSLNHFVPEQARNDVGIEDRSSDPIVDRSDDNTNDDSEENSPKDTTGIEPNRMDTIEPGTASSAPWFLQMLLIGFNGCLIYSCAFGLQNSVIAPAGSRAGGSRDTNGNGREDEKERREAEEELESRVSSTSTDAVQGERWRRWGQPWEPVL